MASIWVESLGRNFDQSLGLLASAVRECRGELWESSMWQVPAPEPGRELLGPDQLPVTDPGLRSAVAQRHSTPWSVAWHALECLDYDLDGESGQWAPPPPFTGHPHWRDLMSLPAAWTQLEILGYIDYCRQQVRTVLAGLTEEKAAAPLPPSHRYAGQPHAWIISSLALHLVEHAAQIRQFCTGAGNTPRD